MLPVAGRYLSGRAAPPMDILLAVLLQLMGIHATARAFVASLELYVELDAGYVVREWRLDLRTVPGSSDKELRLSLPRFL